MTNLGNEPGSDLKYLRGFLAGLLAGSLIGAGVTLLLAPQSGRRTRAEIQHKGIELREQTAVTVEHSLAQARAKAGQISESVSEKTGELEQGAKAAFDEQSDRLSSTVQAGKKTVRELQG